MNVGAKLVLRQGSDDPFHWAIEPMEEMPRLGTAVNLFRKKQLLISSVRPIG